MIGLQGQHSKIMTRDESLEVVRELSAVYKDGKLEKYETSKFTIKANVQPLSGRDLLMVPKGDEFKENYWVFTESQKPQTPWPVTPNDSPPLPPVTTLLVNDRVVRNGVNFTVQQVEEWGAYTRARMVRIDVGPHGGQP